MFTVRGKPKNRRQGDVQVVDWDGGKLYGNPEFVAEIEREARAWDGHVLGPEEGPYTRRNHLASPISAGIVIAGLMVAGTVELFGDVPQRPDLPEGAKG